MSDPKTIHDILKNDIVIPNYQRVYSWSKNHIDEFFEDVEAFVQMLKEDSGKKYFFGPVIWIESESQKQVIDGQQRITTTALFMSLTNQLLVKFQTKSNKITIPNIDFNIQLKNQDQGLFEDLIDKTKEPEKKIEDSKDALNPDLFNAYTNLYKKLILKFEKITKKNVLEQEKKDLIEGKKGLTDEDDKKIQNEKIVKIKKQLEKIENLQFEKNEQRLEFISGIRDLQKAVLGFRVIPILITRFDAHQVFEAINSKGKDLTVTEQLRNYCMQFGGEGIDDDKVKKIEKEKNEIYDKFEMAITNEKNKKQFLTHFARTNYLKSITNDKGVYRLVKKSEDDREKINDFLKKLKQFNDWFGKIVSKDIKQLKKVSEKPKIIEFLKGYNILSGNENLLCPLLIYSKIHKIEDNEFMNLCKLCMVVQFRGITMNTKPSIDKLRKKMEKTLQVFEKQINVNKKIKITAEIYDLFKDFYQKSEDLKIQFHTFKVKDSEVIKYILTQIFSKRQEELTLSSKIPDYTWEHIIPQSLSDDDKIKKRIKNNKISIKKKEEKIIKRKIEIKKIVNNLKAKQEKKIKLANEEITLQEKININRDAENWIKFLKDNKNVNKDIGKFINRWGNWTLLTAEDNSKLKDAYIETKKKIYKKYNEDFINNPPKLNELSMNQRENEYGRLAIEYWKIPELEPSKI